MSWKNTQHVHEDGLRERKLSSHAGKILSQLWTEVQEYLLHYSLYCYVCLKLCSPLLQNYYYKVKVFNLHIQ